MKNPKRVTNSVVPDCNPFSFEIFLEITTLVELFSNNKKPHLLMERLTPHIKPAIFTIAIIPLFTSELGLIHIFIQSRFD